MYIYYEFLDYLNKELKEWKDLDNYLEFNKRERIKYLSKKNKGIITDWEEK